MKYYIISGEASGDLHGSNLIKALKNKDSEAQIRCWGGDLMQQAGGELAMHYKDIAYMGVVEVLLHLRQISKNMRYCKKDILAFKPDAVILIDYAGFNLKIAKFAKLQGLKVLYYISPKLWAWHKSRVYTIKKYVDELYTILPFETEFYKQYNYDVKYVGNPLVDAIYERKKTLPPPEQFKKENNLSNEPIIALLAGSRKQEIAKLLPIMAHVAKKHPQYQYVVAGAPSIDKSLYESIIQDANIKLIHNKTYELLSVAYAAIVTSGTATLETALFKVPEVVLYKTAGWQYHIGKHIVKIKFFSLVNLIMDKEVVKELLQLNLEEDTAKEFEALTQNDSYREEMTANYTKLIEKLGEPGISERTAGHIIENIKANPMSFNQERTIY